MTRIFKATRPEHLTRTPRFLRREGDLEKVATQFYEALKRYVIRKRHRSFTGAEFNMDRRSKGEYIVTIRPAFFDDPLLISVEPRGISLYAVPISPRKFARKYIAVVYYVTDDNWDPIPVLDPEELNYEIAQLYKKVIKKYGKWAREEDLMKGSTERLVGGYILAKLLGLGDKD